MRRNYKNNTKNEHQMFYFGSRYQVIVLSFSLPMFILASDYNFEQLVKVFFLFKAFFLQHWLICRSSDSRVSERRTTKREERRQLL
jgi:hypothetical protein